MVLVHILAQDKSQALAIIDILMDKKLFLDSVISEKTRYKINETTGQLEAKSHALIIARTKALLFQTIDEEIKKHFPNSMPGLYAVPIVYMNEGQAHEIREKTAKI